MTTVPRRRFFIGVAMWAAVAACNVGGVAAQGPRMRADACVACHADQAEERLAAPARDFATDDVHGQRGFDCLACHGSGATTAPMARPRRADIPAMCGRCHADPEFMKGFDPSMRVDQVAEYRTSVHGRLLATGDPAVATCIDCHPAHRIQPAEDTESSVHPANVAATCARCHAAEEVMGPRGVPTDQARAWRSGVHGKALEEGGDLSAPTCNDCHGNHGAAPPGVASVRNVCGQCHSTLQDLFAASGHGELFEAAGLPGCAACHDNHAIAEPGDGMLLSKAQGICGECHRAGEAGASTFVEMHGLIGDLKKTHANAEALLLDAEDRGMEVSQALFELEDVGTALTKARGAIHTLTVDSVRRETESGSAIAERAAVRGRGALREHRERRYGLVFSAGLVAVLVVGLVLKINDMERGASGASSKGRTS